MQPLLAFLKKENLLQSISSLGLQITSIGVVVVSNLLLTWWLTASAFAHYSYLLSWVQLLTNVALFGLYDVQLKEMGNLVAQKDINTQISLFRQVIFGTLLVGFCLAAGIIAVAFLAPTTVLYSHKKAVIIAALQIPLMAIIFQIQAAIRCYGKAGIGLIAEKIARPLAIALFAAIAYWLGYSNNVLEGIILTTICSFIALALALFFLFQQTDLSPTLLINKPLSIFNINRNEQFWFWSVGLVGLLFIRLDSILLGELGHIEQVGVYSVSTKFSDLIGFISQTANYVFIPTYAILYKERQIADFQHLVTRNTRIVAVLSLLLYAVIMLLGKYILAIHGTNYLAGYPIFVLLSSNLFLCVLLGDNYYLLMMCGFGRVAYTTIFIGFSGALVSECLLIPQYGMLGAAIGRSIGMLIWYLLSAIMVYHKIGIIPSIFGRKN